MPHIRGQTLLLQDEKILQEQIFQALSEGLQPETIRKEYRLDNNSVIDFLVQPGIGLEVKIKCATMSIYRQSARYCEFDQI